MTLQEVVRSLFGEPPRIGEPEVKVQAPCEVSLNSLEQVFLTIGGRRFRVSEDVAYPDFKP